VQGKEVDYVVGKSRSPANGTRGAAMETEGFVKIIRDKMYGEILGAHIVVHSPAR